MHRNCLRILFLVVLLLSGCGGTGSAGNPLPSPQHGGSIVALPGERGFVELKTERPPVTKEKKVAPTASTKILAYFYAPDGTTAMSPVPTDVTLRIGTSERGTDVKLSPEPKEAGLLVSQPGSYPDELRGQIALTLGGEPVKADFMLR
jgi:hypothetical protein